MQKIFFILIFFFLGLTCFSCQKYYVSVSQEKIDRNYLASTHVNTPDPRQKNPPKGEQLVLEWKIPKKLLQDIPALYLHVIYQDYTEEFFSYPMSHRMGYAVYLITGEEYRVKKGILTYDAQIKTKNGFVFRDWKHQLSTQLIVLTKSIEEQPHKEEEWGQFPVAPQQRE